MAKRYGTWNSGAENVWRVGRFENVSRSEIVLKTVMRAVRIRTLCLHAVLQFISVRREKQ